MILAKKKNRGHYCKGCGINRPNEKFTGKGRKQHICKECKNSGYTDDGFLDEIVIIEEWDYLTSNSYDKSVYVTVAEKITYQLLQVTAEESLEKAINTSIITILFLSNKISLEQAAFLTARTYNGFIELLERNGMRWEIGEHYGSNEYRNSIPELLMMVDQME